MSYKPLPVGVDSFEKIITDKYYYVDKTLFIKELLNLKGEANLFTRLRGFGKTLNMSMLQCFFRILEHEIKNNLHRAFLMDLKTTNHTSLLTSL